MLEVEELLGRVAACAEFFEQAVIDRPVAVSTGP